MLKTKKLTLNKERLRILTGGDLERAAGGAIGSAGSSWCSSDNGKCTYGCHGCISFQGGGTCGNNP